LYAIVLTFTGRSELGAALRAAYPHRDMFR